MTDTVAQPLARIAHGVLAGELAKLVEREPGTRSGEDPEDLHQMRVSMRRIRTALDLFDEELGRERARAVRRALGPVSTSLGGVRDMDVLLASLAAYTAARDPAERPSLDPLRRDWLSRREAARDALLAVLDSAPYAQAIGELRELVVAAGDTASDAQTSPADVDAASRRIERAVHGVEARRPKRRASMRKLHELRIAAKRLRYTLEFMRAVFGSWTRAVSKPVERLQDDLGALHDAHVSAELATGLLADAEQTFSEAEHDGIEAYVRARRRDVRRLRRDAPSLWRAAAGHDARARIARVLHAAG